MNLDNSIITVLMPVYNGESYLQEAIESILSQTFTNFEFLIIDDCSKDNSINIINSFNDKRIKLVINKKNIGQSRTMNLGLMRAKGKYIARIDQDDVSYNNRLESQINVISGLNKTIIGTWAYTIDIESNIIGSIIHPIDNDSILDSLSLGSPFTHSSIFAEKKDLILLGGYSEKFKIAMDWDLWIKAASKNIQFCNIPEYLVGLRQHSNQASKDNKGKKTLNSETLKLFKKSKKYIKSKKNLNAFYGWYYYHQIINIRLHSTLIFTLTKIISFLLKPKYLINFLKLFFYHKLINKPSNLYTPPILKKNHSSPFSSK